MRELKLRLLNVCDCEVILEVNAFVTTQSNPGDDIWLGHGVPKISVCGCYVTLDVNRSSFRFGQVRSSCQGPVAVSQNTLTAVLDPKGCHSEEAREYCHKRQSPYGG